MRIGSPENQVDLIFSKFWNLEQFSKLEGKKIKNKKNWKPKRFFETVVRTGTDVSHENVRTAQHYYNLYDNRMVTCPSF